MEAGNVWEAINRADSPGESDSRGVPSEATGLQGGLILSEEPEVNSESTSLDKIRSSVSSRQNYWRPY